MANQIYVDPSVGTSAVIKVGGVCYQRVGGVPVAPQVFSVDAELASCDDPGCTNPCANAPSAIAILNYTDTYFSPCTDCTPSLSSDCQWDGTFQFFQASTCTYSNGQCFSGANGCFACKFHSVRMWEFSPPGISSVWYDATTDSFFMQIICQNAPAGGEIVWQGQKTGGATFSGTYTRTGGCDPRATVEIA